VTVNNIKPGQKIKVTVVEGSALPTVKASSQATSKPVAPKNNFKVTTKEPVKVQPKPSGSKASVGVSNLKPGQKIKVTVKTGGTKK
jgi:transglutaminase/protease-like cytokinesis protein 3